MSSTTLVPRRGLIVNNPNRQIERVSIQSEDFSLFNQKETQQRMKWELESAVIATTISESKVQQIENIFYSKENLIRGRNAILNNPLKYYNPFYRKKLKKIDLQLDELDLQIYNLESEASQIKSDLDREIKSAEERLKQILEKPKNLNTLKK